MPGPRDWSCVLSTPRDKHQSVNQPSLAVCTALARAGPGVTQRLFSQENLMRESMKQTALCAKSVLMTSHRCSLSLEKEVYSSAYGLEW